MPDESQLADQSRQARHSIQQALQLSRELIDSSQRCCDRSRQLLTEHAELSPCPVVLSRTGSCSIVPALRLVTPTDSEDPAAPLTPTPPVPSVPSTVSGGDAHAEREVAAVLLELAFRELRVSGVAVR